MSKEFISQAEVARRLNLSRPTVEKMLTEGRIPSVVHYGMRRVKRADFEAWLEVGKDL